MAAGATEIQSLPNFLQEGSVFEIEFSSSRSRVQLFSQPHVCHYGPVVRASSATERLPGWVWNWAKPPTETARLWSWAKPSRDRGGRLGGAAGSDQTRTRLERGEVQLRKGLWGGEIKHGTKRICMLGIRNEILAASPIPPRNSSIKLEL